jgi:hypothetical protein
MNFHGQEIKLGYISLENSNSIVIGSKIKIEINNDFINPSKRGGNAVLRITKYSRKEKKEIIEESILLEKDYNEIVDNILKIKPIDIIQHSKTEIDGDDIELKFASNNGMVEYNIYGLDYTDKDTSYKDFLITVQSILKIAKIKIYGIN